VTAHDILGEVGAYYASKLATHGSTPRGVDWNSMESQRLRFQQLLRVCEEQSGFSINDFGCGYGALVDYMTERGLGFRYRGFDIAEPMLAAARQRHAGRDDCAFVGREELLEVADYTVASGVFNVRLGFDDDLWQRYVLDTLERLNRLSRKGLAFNCLTRHADADRMRGDLYYADPTALFDHCRTASPVAWRCCTTTRSSSSPYWFASTEERHEPDHRLRGGDIARLAHHYFSKDSEFRVAAFTVDREYRREDSFLGLPLVDFESVAARYPPSEFKMFVAVSYTRMNRVRAEKYDRAKELGYALVSYVSSRCSYLSDSPVGDNCFILEDNTIQPFVTIGNDVTLWSGNHIGHDSVVEDHCFISSHVVVSGHVRIGPYCFLGVNATLRNSITVAESTLIGAGAVIMKDTVPKGVNVAARTGPFPKRSDEMEM
jgi:sugar O-acyltransferase (sialic acid O-acetyltransferase NeuD family)